MVSRKVDFAVRAVLFALLRVHIELVDLHSEKVSQCRLPPLQPSGIISNFGLWLFRLRVTTFFLSRHCQFSWRVEKANARLQLERNAIESGKVSLNKFFVEAFFTRSERAITKKLIDSFHFDCDICSCETVVLKQRSYREQHSRCAVRCEFRNEVRSEALVKANSYSVSG